MSALFIPNSRNVRDCATNLDVKLTDSPQSFDRWLNAVRAAAWEEGRNAQAEPVQVTHWQYVNPYRKEGEA